MFYPFTVFYDGQCPLCVKEMRHLKRKDQNRKLRLVDIQHPSFSQQYPQINKPEAMQRIHGMFANGHVISGLDVTYQCWAAVGKGWLIAPLRWPVINWFADKAYEAFARNRYAVSRLLTGQERCQQCTLEQDSER